MLWVGNICTPLWPAGTQVFLNNEHLTQVGAEGVQHTRKNGD